MEGVVRLQLFKDYCNPFLNYVNNIAMPMQPFIFQLTFLQKPGRNVWHIVIQKSLDEVLQRSLHQIHQPVLEEGVNKVHHSLQNPVQRSQARHIYADVANMADLEYGHIQLDNEVESHKNYLEVGQLKTTPPSQDHLRIQVDLNVRNIGSHSGTNLN